MFNFWNSASGDHHAGRYREEDIAKRRIRDCCRKKHREEDIYKIAVEEDTERKIYT